MSFKPNYILGASSVTVFLDGKTYTINKQAPSFNAVVAALKANDKQKLQDAVNIREGITKALQSKNGNVRIEDNKIFYNDREVTGVISTRIFEVIRLGLDVTPMIKFLDNLMKNPSKRAVDEAFGFSEACSLPITPDGCILAYKRVREDYKDVHSATVLNKPYKLFTAEDIVAIEEVQGKRNEVKVTIEDGFTTVSMPRNLVNEDKDQTCSEGLHFCSYDYLKHFGGSRIVVLKINPADIVSIPSDYNNSKGRCSRYQVVDELEVENNMPSDPIPDGYVDDYAEESYNDEQEDTTPAPQFSRKISDFYAGMIREMLKEKSLTEIAKHFKISRRTVARIRDYEAPYNN